MTETPLVRNGYLDNAAQEEDDGPLVAPPVIGTPAPTQNERQDKAKPTTTGVLSLVNGCEEEPLVAPPVINRKD